MTGKEVVLDKPGTTPAELADALAKAVSPETVVRRDEPLARHTTLRVGGPADFYVEPGSEADFDSVLKLVHARNLPLFILGRGSNLLVRDGGFRGLVLCLAHPSFSEVEADGQKLRCGAGARLRAVAAEARRHSLTGFEFLEGIPGTVGGALRMNAGAMGSAIFDVVQSVRCLNLAGEVQIIPASQMCAQYVVANSSKAELSSIPSWRAASAAVTKSSRR